MEFGLTWKEILLKKIHGLFYLWSKRSLVVTCKCIFKRDGPIVLTPFAKLLHQLLNLLVFPKMDVQMTIWFGTYIALQLVEEHCFLLMHSKFRFFIIYLREVMSLIFDSKSCYLRKCFAIERLLRFSFPKLKQRADCFQVRQSCHLKEHCLICHWNRKQIAYRTQWHHVSRDCILLASETTNQGLIIEFGDAKTECS